MPRLALFCLLAAATAHAQIGSSIPDSRLPLRSVAPRATVWQDAGCPLLHTGRPIAFARQVDAVRDCGAIGDGAADDGPALDRALARAGDDGLTLVRLPAGTYRCDRALTLPGQVVLRGDGAERTVLSFNCPSHCVAVTGRSRVGIEDLTMIRTDGQTQGKYFLRVSQSSNCWVRGVEMRMAHSSHVHLREGSHHIEIRECYLHGATDHGGGGNGYGIVLGNDVRDCLIENNVLARLRHCVVTHAQCHGNVYAYNAHFENATDTAGPGIPAWCTGDIEIHGNSSHPSAGGAYENLFEGNYVNLIWLDAFWGDSGPHNTFFRNTARQGGLILEDRSSTEHGGTWSNCNHRQNLVNNACRNPSWIVRQRFGAPWGDGHAFGAGLGGAEHWARNNLAVSADLSGSLRGEWKEAEEPACTNDVSYYRTGRPDFMDAWPYNPFDFEAGNPAARRYRAGTNIPVRAGP